MVQAAADDLLRACSACVLARVMDSTPATCHLAFLFVSGIVVLVGKFPGILNMLQNIELMSLPFS